jgi:putative ribosome biogenesis GTPase RsgA
MAGLVAAAIWLIVRLVVKRKIRDKKASSQPLRQADIKERLREAEKTGVSTAEAQAELQELASRQESGSVHLCFFGEISTGKSSLIKALIPEADVAISAVGGSAGATTRVGKFSSPMYRAAAGSKRISTRLPKRRPCVHSLCCSFATVT